MLIERKGRGWGGGLRHVQVETLAQGHFEKDKTLQSVLPALTVYEY